MGEKLKELLEKNKAWADGVKAKDPEWFTRQARGQAPRYLWIGCADSRVPETEVLGLGPGEVFVHRNIANQALHTDLNMLSVLRYAVHYLKVQHVIVCGHEGCGGVQAALSNQDFGLINGWLRNIKDVCHLHADALNACESDAARMTRAVELNVQQQVQNLAETALVQEAWRSGHALELHGWVYDLETGYVRDIGPTISGVEAIDPIYRIKG